MLRKIILLLAAMLLLVSCDKLFAPVDNYDTDPTYSADSDVVKAVERERYEDWRESEKSKPVKDYFKY